MVDVLLDSTFLLPTMGVEVKEITRRDFQILKELSKSNARFCCSYVGFVEIFGKLCKVLDHPSTDAVNEGVLLNPTRILG